LSKAGKNTIKHSPQTKGTRSNHAGSQVHIFKTWNGRKKKAV